jgi:hypothetical protein
MANNFSFHPSLMKLLPKNKTIKLFAFLLFAFIWFLAGLLPTLVGVFAGSESSGLLGVTHLVAVVTMAAIVATISVEWSLILLALILPWQPLLSMPLAQTLGETGIKALVATKEVYVVVLLGVFFLRQRKWWAFVDMTAILFLVVNLFYIFKSSAPFFTRLISFREGFMIIAFYFVGRFSGLDQRRLRTVLQAIVVISVLVALFGYTERFMFDNSTWSDLGAGEYMAMKFGPGQPATRLTDGIPNQWYTYLQDGTGYKLVRRMVGPIGDATSLSRFLAFSILILIFVDRLFSRHSRFVFLPWLLILMLGGALLLSFGRGGMVIALGGGLIWLFAKNKWIAMIVGVSLFLALAGTALFDIQGGSNARHIKNLVTGVEILQSAPMGRGLGTSGQLALSFGGDEISTENKVSESYIASLAVQMGIPGLGTYFLFIGAILWKLYKLFRKTRRMKPYCEGMDKMALLGIASIAGMFVTSVLANSAVAPISSGLPLFFAGAVVGVQQKYLRHSKVKNTTEGR